MLKQTQLLQHATKYNDNQDDKDEEMDNKADEKI